MFVLIALAAWWLTLPQLTGADAGDPGEHARRRAFVVRSAERLALPLR